MVNWAFMTDPVTNNIALFDEPVPAVSDADYADPNSACNAPLNDPAGNLASVYWHILLDNMEVLLDTTVSVAHPTIPAGSSSSGGSGGTSDAPAGGIVLGAGFDYSYTPVDYVLVAHGLAAAPYAVVAIGNQIVSPGHIVQISVDGVARYVSPWADATNIYLREYASRGATAAAGFSQDYRILAFRPQRAADGNSPPILIDFDPVTGIVELGDGRWSSDRRYLQIVPGGTPFLLAMERTLDLDNGAPRFGAAGGALFDPVPSTANFSITIAGGVILGSTAATPGGYGGSWTGDPYLAVQAP